MMGQNPTQAVQMLKAGNEAWRQSVMGALGWNQNQMNQFINTNALGAPGAQRINTAPPRPQGQVTGSMQNLMDVYRNSGLFRR
jgi:hypothetical protein